MYRYVIAQGLGAPNAPGRTEPKAPLDVNVAKDSGDSNVGITEINNLSADKSGEHSLIWRVQNFVADVPRQVPSPTARVYKTSVPALQ